jgi:uncharacterized protein YkwD
MASSACAGVTTVNITHPGGLPVKGWILSAPEKPVYPYDEPGVMATINNNQVQWTGSGVVNVWYYRPGQKSHWECQYNSENRIDEIFGPYQVNTSIPVNTIHLTNPKLLNPSTPELRSMERHFVFLVNKERVIRGIQPLRIDNDINRAADSHAWWVTTHLGAVTEHCGASNTRSGSRVSEAIGYESLSYSAEITFGRVNDSSHTAAGAYQGFYNSTDHRNIMLNPQAYCIGIGFSELNVTAVFASMREGRTQSNPCNGSDVGAEGDEYYDGRQPSSDDPTIPENTEGDNEDTVTPIKSRPTFATPSSRALARPSGYTTLQTSTRLQNRDGLALRNQPVTVFAKVSGRWVKVGAARTNTRGVAIMTRKFKMKRAAALRRFSLVQFRYQGNRMYLSANRLVRTR